MIKDLNPYEVAKKRFNELNYNPDQWNPFLDGFTESFKHMKQYHNEIIESDKRTVEAYKKHSKKSIKAALFITLLVVFNLLMTIFL